MQHDIRSPKRTRHLIEDRHARRISEPLIVVNLVSLAVLGERHFVHRVRHRPNIASLHQSRIKSLGKEHDLLAPRQHAQRPREHAQQAHLPLDPRTIELIIHQFLAALDFRRVLLHAVIVVFVLVLNGDRRRRLECLRAADLQRIARAKVRRIGDGCREQIAIGGECREQTETALDVNRGDGREIAPLHAAGDEAARRFLGLHAPERRRE